MSFNRLKVCIEAKIGARGGITRSVGTLVGGTAVAQALAVLALPILTRLYTPAEFSILAIYASLLGIIVVVAGLRLEVAIPLPERDEDAAGLLVLALGSSLVISLLLELVFLLFPLKVAMLLGVPEFCTYLWLVPLGVWIASSYSAFQFWATRKKNFTRIARTRMVQAIGGAGVQVGAGVVGVGSLALVVGQMVSGSAGLLGLVRAAWRDDHHALRNVTCASMRDVLRRYSRFPKYSTLEALANNAGIQVPIIVIAAHALGSEAGYLMLATKVMAAPMALIGGSVAQVYLAHASEELRAGRLGSFTTKILSGLSKTGVGPLLFAGIVAAPVFAIVFGAEWRRAGELVTWMTPWFVLQFLTSPVSMVMYVTSKQRAMLVLTVAGLLLRLGALWLAYRFATDSLSEVYAISGAVFYGLCACIFYRVAEVEARAAIHAIGKSMPIIVAWVLGGIFLRIVMGGIE